MPPNMQDAGQARPGGTLKVRVRRIPPKSVGRYVFDHAKKRRDAFYAHLVARARLMEALEEIQPDGDDDARRVVGLLYRGIHRGVPGSQAHAQRYLDDGTLPPVGFQEHVEQLMAKRYTDPSARKRSVASARFAPPRQHTGQSHQRGRGECRPARRRTTKTASSSESPGDGDPPAPNARALNPEEIETGLLTLLYYTGRRAQERAFETARAELENLLDGDRLDGEALGEYVETYRYDLWPEDDRDEFEVWIGARHPGLFERPVNGRSRLVEPVEYGPWLEPLGDDEGPF